MKVIHLFWSALLLFCFSVLFSSCGMGDASEIRQVSDDDSPLLDIENEAPLFELLGPDVTQIRFINKIEETKDQNIQSFAYMYNGGGVAIGDINQDGLQDLLLGSNQETCKLYLNKGNFQFEDITLQAGLELYRGYKTGVNMADVNGDGFLDIYVCSSGFFQDDFRKNLLYINNGDATFTEKAAEYGLDDKSFSTQSYFLDYDLDGDLDLYLLNHPLNPKEANNLKGENDANGNPTIVLSKDLTHVTDRLYKNEGSKFVDVTENSGITNEAFGLSAVVNDFNQDGFPDIYICNDYVKPDYLYINQGDGTFTDRFADFFSHTSFSSMGSDCADLNNDGCPELMTLDMFPESNHRQKMHGTAYNYDKYLLTQKFGLASQFIKNTLQTSNCDGTYSDLAMMAGVAHTDWSWSVLMADYNNDGWKDIYITNGYRRNTTDNDFAMYVSDSFYKNNPNLQAVDIQDYLRLIPSHKLKNYFYMNRGQMQFANMSDTWDPSPAEFSNGAAYADLDNDGYLDMVTNNIDSPVFILKNTGANSRKNHFIRFKLQNSKGKTTYGAKVEITDANGKKQYQQFYPARGFLSSTEPVIHFGLGNTSSVKEVKVIWPDQQSDVFTNLAIDKVHELTYKGSAGKAKKLVNPEKYFAASSLDLPVDMKHIENDFIDFKREPLLHRKFSEEGPAACRGDINQDGLDDVFLGGAMGQAGRLFLQESDGNFSFSPQESFIKDKQHEDTDAAFADVDSDGDLDLIVVSGGNEFPDQSDYYTHRLYLNDGKGTYLRKADGLPNIHSSASCIALADLDSDGDLDLFVGGRVVPGNYPTSPISFLARNDQGKFTHVTPEWAEGLFRCGLVTDAEFTDLDGDNVPELIITGEWMYPRIFKKMEGKYQDVSDKWKTTQLTGWWETVFPADVNGDGKTDLICGNSGLNSYFKATSEKPITLHFKDYDKNGTLDPILCQYNGDESYPYVMRDKLLEHMVVLKKKFVRYKYYADATMSDLFDDAQRKDEQVLSVAELSSIILYNRGDQGFEAARLPYALQESCLRTIAAHDVDGDGKEELITGGNFYGTDVFTGRYDGSSGTILKFNGEKISTMKSALTGFQARGNVRKILPVKSKNGVNLLVVRNHDAPQLFEGKAAQNQ